jgi:hypothetical protein
MNQLATLGVHLRYSIYVKLDIKLLPCNTSSDHGEIVCQEVTSSAESEAVHVPAWG